MMHRHKSVYTKCLLARTKHTVLPGATALPVESQDAMTAEKLLKSRQNGTETVVARFSGIGWRTLVHLQHFRQATVSHDRAADLAQANTTAAYSVKKGPAVNDRFMSFRYFVSPRN